MNGTPINGTNNIAKKLVSSNQTPNEENVYPKLFKVVHKDLFNVPGDKKENISLNKNGENNLEIFLNFKFNNLEVFDKESTVSNNVNESDDLVSVTSIRKGSGTVSLDITNDIEGQNSFLPMEEMNQSKSFPELLSKLENSQDSSRSSKSFSPSLPSMQNLCDRVKDLETSTQTLIFLPTPILPT
jgi:hypothetical protein